VQNWKLVGTW